MSTLQFTVKEIKLLVILITSKNVSTSNKPKLQCGTKVLRMAPFLPSGQICPLSLCTTNPSPQTNIVFKTLKSFFNHKQH